MKSNILEPLANEDRTGWTCFLQDMSVDLIWRRPRAQKYRYASSMMTSCSSVVLVISMVDGGTMVGELWSATGVEGRVPWDPGRDDEAEDGVKLGMQVTWLVFPSAWMMMVVPRGLSKWTKYKTRTTRAIAIRQANRHTRNVFQSDHGFAVTCKVL